MAIRDFIDRFISRSNPHLVRWQIDETEGLDVILEGDALTDPEQCAIEDPIFGLKYTYLKSLHEQGSAEKFANGYTIPSPTACELDDDFNTLFELPDPFTGILECRIKGQSGRADFSIECSLAMPSGEEVVQFRLSGPILSLGQTEQYRLSPAQWRALHAIKRHQTLSPERRGEYENLWLVFELQMAKKAGAKLDLGHFNNMDVVQPESIGVSVEELSNGDIAITPAFGSGIHADDVKRRLGQLSPGDPNGALRVNNQIVLLDEERLEAVEEILTTRIIPKSQVKSFFESPTAYLNAAMIDLDTGFSLRAHGAEVFSHKYFGDVEKSGTNWFDAESKLVEPTGNLAAAAKTREELDELERKVSDARKNGATVLEHDGRKFDISDHDLVSDTLKTAGEKVDSSPKVDREVGDSSTSEDMSAMEERAVVAIDSNDEDEEFSRAVELDGFSPDSERYDTSNLKRTAFPHQEEGIRWLLAHLDAAWNSERDTGALLADDMGLGKTFMTLVAASEYQRRIKLSGHPSKPMLIVAPLSLIENWQAEVFETFHKSPFEDIVVLQAGGDLTKYKVKGAGRETRQVFDDGERIEDLSKIRYSLKIGKVYGSDRLDLPNRLVLTTYQTLTDYQFSLSRVDWSIVAFDEAQSLKNPNTLTTRAAKALKSDFKLLATGTPVENSLKDFWCLMDTCVPGLLGAWQDFRATYIAPILGSPEEEKRQRKIDVGRRLRDRVGEYMLRRTKEEKLKGLPQKKIYSGYPESRNAEYLPVLAGLMKDEQLQRYEDIVANVKDTISDDRRSLVLPSLQKLRITSIHHGVAEQEKISGNIKELIEFARKSSKIESLLCLLDEIKGRDEKVIIFATDKSVQRFVSVLVSTYYKVKVETINGETKAVAKKKSDLTRKGIIDEFQNAPGFGVIIMSPVAAGVGLTVTGANNVIHLERHWNPAKEAQATDRVYRIGQQRDVNVYLPMALHPEIASFDVQLNSLLSNKIDLSDAVVANEEVDSSDLAGVFA